MPERLPGRAVAPCVRTPSSSGAHEPFRAPPDLNPNATTPIDPEGVDAMLPYRREEFGNWHPHGWWAT